MSKSRATHVSLVQKACFTIVLALFAALCGAVSAAPLRGPVDVTIIHTSDIHAHLMPFDCASGTAMGGYARMKAYRDTLVTKGRNVVLLSSGDVFQGTLFYRFYRGIPDATFMSQMGYAAMAIGNHEFDGGQDGMFEAFRDAKFPILSANLRFGASKSLSNLVKPSTIVTVPAGDRNLRIGIIGITDEELEKDVQKVFLKGIEVENAVPALRREVKHLRAQGCDAIFALTHIGWDRDLELADQFPEITGFMGGHTHMFSDPPLVRQVAGGHQFISQPGEFGSYVSRLDLRFEPAGDGIRCQVLAAGLVPLTSDMPEDPAIKATVDQLWKKVEEKTSEKLADTVTRLDGDRPLVRRQETNLGNLVADAFVRVMPAEIGLVNGGGIRSSIPAGPVRVADCLNVMPFDNYLARLKMTGATLQKLFEQVRSDFLTTPSYGGFMHVSRGFKVRYTPAGVELTYLGRPIEPETVYTVVTNDFLANGGNGLTPFTEALASEASAIICADAMMQHVKALQAIDARVEGRIELQIQPAGFRHPAQRLRIPRPAD
ncbi:MAG TPA: bifunctional UDP-sugar hydrolase/5'-nucleotidase [Candidatus Ozemobacteraceae bacterium]|nr:bifunctional UDP-sugar hydrolase/5'-nucleotidase [Candidatus Ozemobacteraceae bacterium]